MSAYTFGAALQPTTSTKITSPPAVKKKGNSAAPLESAIELQDYMQQVQTQHSEHENGTASKTPNELEMSRPSSPTEAAEFVPSWSFPAKNKYRVSAICLVYLANGLTDASAGALIPYMEKQYGIGYAIVSLIFITNAIGFITAAFFTDLTLEKLGRAKACMLSEVLLIVGYVILVCTPPFPVVVVAFLFLGLGVALNLALNNVFCANLANSTVILGAVHGSYGLGGVIGPIMATVLVSRGILWSRFYLIVLGLHVICFFATGWAFWKYEDEPSSLKTGNLIPRRAGEIRPTKLQMMKRALNSRVTIFAALFIFAYQGSEVSTSGWVISFLIQARGGDPAKVGYVTAGFWGGITLGRFVLSHLAPRIGEKRFVYILTALSIVFQLLVWLIPNIIGEAVAVSLLGLLLGPVYSCATTIFTRLMGRDVQMTALSFVSSAGSSGGAVAPFLTGLLAQAVGTFVLHPICIGLFVVMAGCWYGLPNVAKRTD
ncbi:MFS general substrate transporter [Aureobasidium pullulans]|uniref:MFS general substrate transporter n=1 Tax=Aureobasidium pullulans TaxID=5580 RepID=A0A4S9USW5_AURPU|nr:MFS general substrate transporter [Aureobasidium pullulans]THZ41325.1 MFS general substrate transporter [Aureobasidium pullulans]THZ58899.1 MFS general substrate transporter [Aureobasidium pullulans]TIA74165.1 MFS general substrate transporter [Aureobasidium pullulans]